jgi:hypothetical protein
MTSVCNSRAFSFIAAAGKVTVNDIERLLESLRVDAAVDVEGGSVSVIHELADLKSVCCYG